MTRARWSSAPSLAVYGLLFCATKLSANSDIGHIKSPTGVTLSASQPLFFFGVGVFVATYHLLLGCVPLLVRMNALESSRRLIEVHPPITSLPCFFSSGIGPPFSSTRPVASRLSGQDYWRKMGHRRHERCTSQTVAVRYRVSVTSAKRTQTKAAGLRYRTTLRRAV